ncbi:hypothetical protein [Anaerosolibacter sp.]
MHAINFEYCPNCGLDEFEWDEKRKLFKCKKCGCYISKDGFIIR